ncbi:MULTISPECIES: ABC transporter ATP-binding protein [Clostridium]|jgi:putative ABC transport system ATP-binding protein|nr:MULTISPECIES: ATP-binding cassette domain-containing protein [Clostridium]MBS5305056.1 ATP-binding cassette domain-containing protein [Clostridium sp.]MDB1932330.1 ATP-binding cassette domain-containing protein [Clostridium tertium]MDB1942938.1 ATP-binding cassette domain-containing protein [Clostridium tertium]MDB1950039.1 ATP-binding cassette domain-containing protein [Clostridium tertium]MDB1968383.1 ATP-binding cassette domain-containing protein [Clostridium tertium]
MNILSIKDVFYNMGDLEILKGISFDIEKGDCISIVGQSGSGKSTLLKVCADMIPITSGNIYFNGKCYTSYNPIELRKKISYCLQTPELFGKSVCENLEFPFKIRKEQVNKQRIVKLLERFNIDESFLDKDIISLSGGEKQRISIIRNLLYTPDIILLDEATSALDLENAKVVEEYIKELNDLGVTVLWITHSMEQSEKIFNKRITISEGKIECMEVLR